MRNSRLSSAENGFQRNSWGQSCFNSFVQEPSHLCTSWSCRSLAVPRHFPKLGIVPKLVSCQLLQVFDSSAIRLIVMALNLLCQCQPVFLILRRMIVHPPDKCSCCHKTLEQLLMATLEREKSSELEILQPGHLVVGRIVHPAAFPRGRTNKGL